MPALNPPSALPQPRPRIPEWLRFPLPTTDRFSRTRALLDELKLHTVCESAKCPNHWECWSKGTATFMIGATVPCAAGFLPHPPAKYAAIPITMSRYFPMVMFISKCH